MTPKPRRSLLQAFTMAVLGVVTVVLLIVVAGSIAWLAIGKSGHRTAEDAPGAAAVNVGPVEIPTWTETLTVASGSMSGYADPGAVLLVNANLRHQPEQLTSGDVITYYLRADDESSRVTHRIDEVLPDGAAECGITDELLFRTKGDANDFADPYCVRPVQITGQVTAVLPPAVGTVARAAHVAALPVLCVALFLLAGVLLLSSMRDRARARHTAAPPEHPDAPLSDPHAPLDADTTETPETTETPDDIDALLGELAEADTERTSA